MDSTIPLIKESATDPASRPPSAEQEESEMFTGESEAAVRRRTLKAAMERAMCAAQDAMAQAEYDEIVQIARWAARGVQVVRWRPPGAADLRCPLCRQADNWYQWVAGGCVTCACQLPA
jgi:hypothetical protein